MTHFFIHLPSNSSSSYYPDNTRGQYITRLLNKVELQGDWEVGLYEIQFSKTWYNIRQDATFVLKFQNCLSRNSKSTEFSDRYYNLSISEGNYSNPGELIEAINSRITQLSEVENPPIFQHEYDSGVRFRSRSRIYWPDIKYNDKSNKAVITLQKGQEISFSDNLRRILGFNKSSHPIKSYGDIDVVTLVESDRTVDLSDGLEAFYVYCDIVEGVRVGDTEVPLLRIVNSGEEKSNTFVRRHYENPMYVPVQKKNFEQIEIQLLTDQGQVVPFQRGRVILTLHFRRSDANYFL